jgi:hypothetical protein
MQTYLKLVLWYMLLLQEYTFTSVAIKIMRENNYGI